MTTQIGINGLDEETLSGKQISIQYSIHASDRQMTHQVMGAHNSFFVFENDGSKLHIPSCGRYLVGTSGMSLDRTLLINDPELDPTYLAALIQQRIFTGIFQGVMKYEARWGRDPNPDFKEILPLLLLPDGDAFVQHLVEGIRSGYSDICDAINRLGFESQYLFSIPSDNAVEMYFVDKTGVSVRWPCYGIGSGRRGLFSQRAMRFLKKNIGIAQFKNENLDQVKASIEDSIELAMLALEHSNRHDKFTKGYDMAMSIPTSIVSFRPYLDDMERQGVSIPEQIQELKHVGKNILLNATYSQN